MTKDRMGHRASTPRVGSTFRLLLRFLPEEFRQAYGPELRYFLEDRLAEASGPLDRHRIRWVATLDLAFTNLTERWHRSRSRRDEQTQRPGDGGSRHHGSRRPHRSNPSSSLGGLLKDIQYAARTLRRSPGFTGLAVLTLGLGIGGTTVAFSLVSGILLRPLPFPEDQELVSLRERRASGEELTLSFPNFEDWRTQTRTLEGIAAIRFPEDVTVLGGTESTRGTMVAVSREFFTLLGAQPFLGRPILPEENREGGEPVVVVSCEFWNRALGGKEDLNELSLSMGPVTFRVVGVMPPGFKVLEKADIYVPLERGAFRIRDSHNYRAIARLAEGSTLAMAKVEMDGIARRIHEAYPNDTETVAVSMTPLREVILGPVTRPLFLLMGASALLLLLACSNVASTLLARGNRRQREMAIRTALGARKGRLVRLALVESLLIAALAGGAGVVLSVAILDILHSQGVDLVPRLEATSVDMPVLAFALAVTLVTSLLFGLFPALKMPEGSPTVRGGQTGGTARTSQWGWNTLVGGQAALAVLLVVAASLLLRSVGEILSSDTRFEVDGVLTVALDFGSTYYPTFEERGESIRALEEEFESLPGVTAVGWVNHLPFEGTRMTGGIFEPPWPEGGFPERVAENVGWRVVDEDYFSVMRIPILEGRVFGPRDQAESPPVIVLNEAAARTLYPDQDAIGRRVQFVPFWEDQDLEVVGIVAEARDWRVSPGEQAEGFIYWPQRAGYTRYLTAVIRTTLDPALLTNPVRERIRALTPTVPGTIRTLEALVADSFRDRTFTLAILGAFAALSLLLAAVGIYGVVSYTVSARTREIGIQLALGAEPSRLRRQTFVGSGKVVLAGALAGTILALALGNVMRGLLYQVSPRDPASLAAAPVILMAAAALAIWIPVLRYTRVDPASSMREG